MKRKVIFLTFKALPFFLLALLILSSLLLSGCSPSDIIFGPSGSIEVDTYPAGAKIFLNGNDTGHITPYTIENLVKGTYEITVTLGDLSYTEKVIVYSDITTSVYKDLLPRLNKIVVQPTSMNLKEGDSQTIDSITAYYFDSGPAVIKLSACSYSSNSNHATVNSVGTITGISKGSATITVSYTDVEITKTDTVTIIVNEPEAPTAKINTIPDPPIGFAPLEIHFDAYDSESDVDIKSYSWDFGDGSISTGIAITHTYNNVGMYTVVLDVTDSDGRKGYDTKVITVSEAEAPTAKINTIPDPPIGIAPFEVYFDAYESYVDPECGFGCEIVNYEWDFGDGHTGTGSEINHTYSNIGSYTVILAVTDNNGKKGYDNLKIIVTKEPTAVITTVPTAVDGVVTGASSFTVYFDAYQSTSESGIVSYKWEFGDDSIGDGITVNHTYDIAGIYIVYLTITDSNEYEAYDSVSVSVNVN